MSTNEVGEIDRPQVPGHRVDAVLGAGASAVVWSGTDAAGRRVAIKVPHRGGNAVDDEASLVEQQVLLAVQHDHLVPLRSVVPLADGREALVFDLVEGARLGGMVRSRGHLRAGEVVTVLTPICEAVAHLHAAGGVHSDISPSNVMVTPEGRPVLLDLGAVRVAGATPGAVHGTIGFVAPEVRLGSEPGDAADVYALGAVAWFCLTGNGAPDTMMRLDPETVVSHVGAELAVVVAAAIDPEPERRPGAAELARLFYDAVAPEPVEVVVDADPAAALTHRLRAQAVVEAPSLAGDRGGRWSAWPRPGAAGGSGWLRGGRWSALPRWLQAAGWSHWPRWLRPTAASTVVAVPLLAVAGWALAAQVPAASPSTTPTTALPRTSGPSAARAAPSPRPGTASGSGGLAGGTTSAPGDPPAAASGAGADALLRDPTSPSNRPEDVLQVLSDRRASALTARDAGTLRAVHAPGSASLASDHELVGALVEADTRWQGLRLEVAEARFVSGSPTVAVLRARIDWTAYVVVRSGHTRTKEPADMGRELDFTLVRGRQGWRISAISAAPAT
ncbi:serine/threonine-protein kinase [Terrabacter terrae]|uniref:serine/threonine-protein kinase n=1 Tax=Terrabacter terrae TaxID=318434 RepID=UPI0031DFA7CF